MLTAFDGQSITYDAIGAPHLLLQQHPVIFTWVNGRNGGLTIGNKVRILSPNHPQAYEAGGTLLKIGGKYQNIRFDVGAKSLFHINIQLAKWANYHFPFGTLVSGLWGGLTND